MAPSLHDLRGEEAGSPPAYNYSHIFPLFWLLWLFWSVLPGANILLLALMAASSPFFGARCSDIFRFWRHFLRQG